MHNILSFRNECHVRKILKQLPKVVEERFHGHRTLGDLHLKLIFLSEIIHIVLVKTSKHLLLYYPHHSGERSNLTILELYLEGVEAVDKANGLFRRVTNKLQGLAFYSAADLDGYSVQLCIVNHGRPRNNANWGVTAKAIKVLLLTLLKEDAIGDVLSPC